MQFVCVMPPHPRTILRFTDTGGRILDYARAHGELPSDLSALPEIAGKRNNTRDGWGRPILFSSKPDGTVILTSYGKDGRPGGDDEKADLVYSFKARNDEGEWKDRADSPSVVAEQVQADETP